jgi:Carboxypeptidase regulatory-like domain
MKGSKGRRFSLKVTVLIALMFLLAFAAGVARAQGEAEISGVVTDSDGAVIPGTSVRVQNSETGAVRDLLTDEEGRYDAPLLPIGNYAVTADKTGFQSESKTGITLIVGERATINLSLHLGEIHQTVTVSDAPALVAISTEDTSGLVGQQQVKDLPLNGRSYDQLLALNPSVVNYTSQRAGGTGTSNSVVGNMFSVSGRRPQENLYLLNGVEFTSASEVNNTPGGVSGQLLGVDAVREFSVVSDTYGAEYGKRPGAQVNIVTASGTNQFHGSAYEFLRNSYLDAKNYFDNGLVAPFERNVFGSAAGGPIQKDKTFIFANYEGYRQRLGLSDLTLDPDANARTGELPCSGLATVPANCTSTTPLTHVALGAGVAQLLNLWPAPGPELLTPGGLPTGIAESFTNPLQRIEEDFGTARIDRNFSDKDSLQGVYTVDDSRGDTPSTNPITFDQIYLREQVASLSETRVFSSSVVNRATFGFSRGAFYFNSSTTVNVPGWIHADQPVGALVVGGGTTLNGASQLTNGGTNAGSNLSVVRNIFTPTDQVTFTHGRHVWNFGVWFERLQSNDTLIQDQYGQESFTNLQSFLQGTVSTYTYAPGFTPLNWRSLEGAAFAEDTFKVTPNFELRLGFRGEFTNGWNEAHGRGANYYFTDSVIQSQPTIGSSVFATNPATFLPEPRVGIAWSPLGSKKTVIRAGFGTYNYLLDNLSYRLDQTPPYNTVYAVKGVTAAGTGHTLSVSSISPTSNYSALGFNDSVIPSGVNPNLKTPTVESYSFKIEQEVLPNTTLGIGYVGSHAFHEISSVDENLPSATYPYPTQVITATSTGLANPSVWNTTHWFSDGISNYNGLAVDVNHRTSHGLLVRGTYTYAKALNDGDSMNTSVATNSPAFAENPRDLRADYGRASFDIRNSAVINAIYDLPVGRGDARSLSARLLGNWQLSGIETLQSGLPFTPQLSYNPSNDGDTRNPVRPSWNPNFSGPIILGGPTEYFNPNAFIQPAAGTYGNVGRNALQGPGLATTDLSLQKRFIFTERFNLQFRAEFFNIFNRVNFNTPNPVVFAAAAPAAPSPTAGVITSTSTTSRQVQFGLKLLW